MQLGSKKRGSSWRSLLAHLAPASLRLNFIGGGGYGESIAVETRLCDGLWNAQDSVEDSVKSMMVKAASDGMRISLCKLSD